MKIVLGEGEVIQCSVEIRPNHERFPTQPSNLL